MASQVQICNQALTRLGAQRITSLLDDSRNASTLNALYDIKRDAELAAHPWTFAIRRVELPASATAPAFTWAYQYPLPSDYLAMVQVGDSYVFYQADESGALFDIEGTDSGQAVLTNEASPLQVRYIKRITNTGLYPALFVEALACRLAAESCDAITQNLSKQQAMWDQYKEAIRRARRQNAIELPPRTVPPSSWVRAMLEG